jgi:hypothetical protein
VANIIYNAGLRDLLVAAKTFDAGTYKCALERSTSTYTPNKDDDSLLDQAGLVLITVASYSVKTIATPTITAVDASDLVKIDCDDVAFGNLEAGQTVKAILIYRDDGGNGVPLLRIDTDSGSLLPRALGGGAFTISINASGLLTLAQV